jgi:hypothetical protein
MTVDHLGGGRVGAEDVAADSFALPTSQVDLEGGDAEAC